MFYLTTHSTHFIYAYMASDIWLRTILIVRKETHCRHIGYDDSRVKIALWNDPQIIVAHSYDDDRAKIALWNDPQIIVVPTYNDSRVKITLWNEPQIIVAPTYDDSRAKIALWNDP